uniref:Uncharacterized protein n=1 Tax=Arundo donax TaxID=35708 RepID=A0A0A8XUG2_ARUDO
MNDDTLKIVYLSTRPSKHLKGMTTIVWNTKLESINCKCFHNPYIYDDAQEIIREL